MRFASHRDVARAVERAVRVAALPVGYSAGFSPHPRISYAGGAPTGAASEAEYLEISLTRECDPADVRQRLDSALPDGIDVIEVVEASGPSAATRLEASLWEVVWPGVAPGAAEVAVRAFLDAPEAEVERLTSKGVRRFDARAAVERIEVGRRAGASEAGECAILRMIVRQATPAVRPDDVMVALRKSLGQSSGVRSSGSAPASPEMVTRLWQGPLDSLAAAEKGMILDTEAHGPSGVEEPSAAESRSAGWREELTAGKAMGLPSGRANAGSDGPDRANEQLPRAARAQLAGLRAREPEGRDFPHARDRANQWPFRSGPVS
jgi:radical SAM-linked protein